MQLTVHSDARIPLKQPEIMPVPLYNEGKTTVSWDSNNSLRNRVTQAASWTWALWINGVPHSCPPGLKLNTNAQYFRGEEQEWGYWWLLSSSKKIANWKACQESKQSRAGMCWMSERLQLDVEKRGRADGPKDVTIATNLFHQQFLCATTVALSKNCQYSMTLHYAIFRKMYMIFFILSYFITLCLIQLIFIKKHYCF